MNKNKTIFCDIDGTLIKHHGNGHTQIQKEPVILEGVIEKFVEWDRQSYKIILVTGRKESTRFVTEQQLRKIGIFYDQLIMGIGPGKRYLINDFKPNSQEKTAIAINLTRNKGIKDVEI